MLSLKQAMVPQRPLSSLEEMLASIDQLDNKKPTDSPPALPQRPTSKARLPSAARMRKAVSVAVATTGYHEVSISGNQLPNSGNQLSNPGNGSNQDSNSSWQQSSDGE